MSTTSKLSFENTEMGQATVWTFRTMLRNSHETQIHVRVNVAGKEGHGFETFGGHTGRNEAHALARARQSALDMLWL